MPVAKTNPTVNGPDTNLGNRHLAVRALLNAISTVRKIPCRTKNHVIQKVGCNLPMQNSINSCIKPETTKVPNTAGSGAHLGPTTFTAAFNVGSYTVGRRMLVTMRFHLLPQKSCSEVELSGSLNCGSSSNPIMLRAMAATMAKIISNKKQMWKQYMHIITSG